MEVGVHTGLLCKSGATHDILMWPSARTQLCECGYRFPFLQQFNMCRSYALPEGTLFEHAAGQHDLQTLSLLGVKG
eukprot:6557633-Karenia_brevis.AAC.1